MADAAAIFTHDQMLMPHSIGDKGLAVVGAVVMLASVILWQAGDPLCSERAFRYWNLTCELPELTHQ